MVERTDLRANRAGTVDVRSRPAGLAGAFLAWAEMTGVGILVQELRDGPVPVYLNDLGRELLGVDLHELREFPPPMPRNGSCHWEHPDGVRLLHVDVIRDEHAGTQRRIVFFRKGVPESEGADQLLADLDAITEDMETFTRAATHDLRAPLRSIAASAALLERRSTGADPDQQKLLQGILDGTKRMDELISALAQLAIVGNRAVEHEPVDLNVVVGEVLADLSWHLNDPQLHLDVAPLPTVQGDPVLLRELLQNLLANALKFRRQEGMHRVTVEQEEGDDWIIRVTDNGVGFDPGAAADLFRPFQRYHDRDTFPGSGIGLATCKRIVELHEGSITVSSTPGAGTAFTVRLPRY